MEINYAPPPIVAKFMRSEAFVKAIMGPFGSGKSVGCVMELLRRATLAPKAQDGKRKTRYVIIRNTFRMLHDTTLKTTFEWIPPKAAGKWISSRNTFYINFGDVESEWMFRALDDPDDVRNLLSLEVTAAWINEYREIDPNVFTNLLGRVGRFRPDKDTPRGWYGIIMDTNPPPVDSYWYNLFEEETPEEVEQMMRGIDRPMLELFKQPSGLAEDAENVENLPPNYYQTLLASNSHRNKEWVNVHIHGRYGFVQHGKPVFPEFADIHASDKHLAPNKRLPIVLGMDFGLTPAAIAVQQTPLGQWLVLDELTADNTGIERFAEKLKPWLRSTFPDHDVKEIWADPAGKDRSQVDEKTCFMALRAAGFTVRGGPQDLESRLGSVRRVLNRMIDGSPGIVISPQCRTLLKGFYGRYYYRRQKKQEEMYDEKPEKNDVSHIHDALQYVIGAYESRGIKGQNNRPFVGGFNKPIKVEQNWNVYA